MTDDTITPAMLDHCATINNDELKETVFRIEPYFENIALEVMVRMVTTIDELKYLVMPCLPIHISGSDCKVIIKGMIMNFCMTTNRSYEVGLQLLLEQIKNNGQVIKD